MVSRFAALFSKQRLDRRLDEELRAHIEMMVEENVRQGMSPEEARHEALLAFGGVEQIKETYRDARGFRSIDTWMQDLRYAGRMIRRNPGFSALVGLVLALGVGANAAVFSVLNSLFLRPLPYPNAGQLVMADEVRLGQNHGLYIGMTRYLNYQDWRIQNRVFSDMAAFRADIFNVNATGQAERVRGDRVSAEFFRLLDAKPLIGRALAAEDFEASAPRVAVLAHRYWLAQFDGRSDVVGRSVRVEGHPTTIVGVMPARFRSALIEGGARFWMPFIPEPAEISRDDFGVTVMARLKPGISIERARSDMSIIAQRLEQQYPDSNRDWGVRLQGLEELSVRAGTTSLPKLLLTAVALLLLTACANIANLLLARGVERRKEIALRVALGAGRLRVVRQLMVENLLFALLGAAGGLLAGYWLISLLSWAAVSILDESGLPKFEMDSRVLLFALGVSAMTAVLFGIVPAVRGARVDLNSALKEGGTGNSAGVSKRRLSGALVISQVTLSLVLLISAGLTVKGIYELYGFNWGFPLENRLSMGVALSSRSYGTDAKRLRFFRGLLDEAERLPGVQSAALVSALPVGFAPATARVRTSNSKEEKPVSTAYRIVSANYMRALGIPLRKGRPFSEGDTSTSPAVALVNERMARKFWSETDPIGSRIEVNGVPRTIVGVIGDVVNQGLLQKPGYEVCTLYTQSTPAAMTLVIHASGNPLNLAAPARRIVERLDPDQPVFDVRSLRAAHERLCAPLGFILLLLSIFAAVALTLAGAGIYGVTAHSVSARTREIGIRVAMGASRGQVVSQVLAQAGKLALGGILAGGAAAFVMSRLVLSKIWWLGRTGPELIAGVALLLGLVALAASYVPARRATKIDAARALRAE